VAHIKLTDLFQPITDLSSNNIICNTGFITPVSQTVMPVKGGDQVTAIFHKTSAGDPGHGDPADPLDPTNKGMTNVLLRVLKCTQTSMYLIRPNHRLSVSNTHSHFRSTPPIYMFAISAAIPDATQTTVTGTSFKS
jgi:hypothetical protein